MMLSFLSYRDHPRALASSILAALLLLLTACSTKHVPTPAPEIQAPRSPQQLGTSLDPATVQRSLHDVYASWRGTPHRMGGTDKGGVDCSGFVTTVYKDVFHTDLPRTTAAQLTTGTPVKRSALKPGDLVFFRPPGYPRHVGIYLDKNRFLHASKSRGVTISRIDGHYWKRYFWTARRVLSLY